MWHFGGELGRWSGYICGEESEDVVLLLGFEIVNIEGEKNTKVAERAGDSDEMVS